MATASTTKTQTASANLKALEDTIKSQVDEAKAKLDQFEANAKAKASTTEAATVNHLRRRSRTSTASFGTQDTTTHVARAKTEIEAAVAKFKASVEALGTKFKNSTK